ncbi:MAG TPA: hypothetical protein VJ836_03710 [Candidatus Saccharimonadales bacterium]|nr:hypothetical protein [Candidatus Saccharimonadales bacterium]
MVIYEHWPVGATLLNARNPLGEEVERFVALEDENNDPSLTLEACKQIARTASPAFRAIREPVQIVGSAVAAAQEHQYIGSALCQYTDKDEGPVRKIIVGCNYPPNADPKAVGRTVDTVRRFIKLYGEQVPIAYFEFESRINSTGMPPFRNTIARAALAACLRGSISMGDVGYMSHDADISLSPAYFSRLHADFTKPRPFPTAAVTTFAEHYPLYDGWGKLLFPNMASVVGWIEATARLAGRCFDLGHLVSARALMAVDGYGAGDTIKLLNRIYGQPYFTHPARANVEETIIRSSPRGPYFKLAAGQIKEGKLWGRRVQQYESYREVDYSTLRDITTAERDQHIYEAVFGNERSLLVRLPGWYEGLGFDPTTARQKAIDAVYATRARWGGPDSIIPAHF